MDVLIVGAGSMGRWIADAIDTPVAFTDVDETEAQSAADAVGGRAVPLETDERFAAVCLAVPMTHVARAIETHASNAERAIFDVSGVMGPALEAMDTHAADRERVSLHPLFAPERAPGSIAVVREEPGPVTDAICATLETRGNDLVETTAAEHDGAMETVQAATHAAILSFALATEPVPEEFETPVYEELRGLAELVTGGTPRVYADIQDTFDGADAVAGAAHRLADADSEELEALYREAAEQWRPTGAARADGEASGTQTNETDQ
ncbi:prephenate dehydrogenase/arogenate dehydrogenase family protein [Halobacteria archaeon AArc-m2/3/4]|uniref:Prephenate dehydrogenase/arogenate dehydrogenase family protein n=1 Tax=Natronoglomus mannanivorans TaxID=2979990 RepID=A0AAP3E227_9EURY|nr:prephenate dehydrogenase/arogenate dehydrogenase family protein [Halobacteria archaeon AArc-xg1-1]MCU4975138.1 prephenate dehydrogenase/arogenate dehydrogenase family protein [Halobacteria archaeon AArc-m2/3/4]